MAATKISGDTLKEFKALTAKPYAEQAKWFLNAFWHDLFEGKDDECESVWTRTQEFVKLDEKMREDGNELDEALSHKFLENLGETLTVLELRARLREIDLDMNGMMSLSEYLLFRYGRTVEHLLRPQADPKEIQKATQLVNEAAADQAQCDAANKVALDKLDAQTKAKQAVEEAKAEAQRTLDALHAEEKALADKIADLEKRSQEGTVVSKGRAVAELGQLQSQDPLPLRMAKINQGAAVRKVEKALKLAEAAVAEAVKAQAAAEAALRRANESFNAAVAFLEEVKSRAGSSEGAVWWLERAMEEIRRYRPGYTGKLLKKKI